MGHKVSKDFGEKIIKPGGAMIQAAAAIIPGKKMGFAHLTEQDDLLFLSTPEESIHGYNVYAVFDGHGPNGHIASEMARRILLMELQISLSYPDVSVPDCLQRAFAAIQTEMKKSFSTFAESGCTASVVIRFDTIIWVGNVGDSEVYLGRKTRISISNRPVVEAVLISGQHTLANKKERIRIKPFVDARIEMVERPDHFGVLETSWILSSQKGIFPASRISRSLGDLKGEAIGISPIPHIKMFRLRANDSCIVMGTKGFWNALSHSRVVNSIDRIDSVVEAISTLTKTALDQYKTADPNWIDDMTVVALKVELDTPERRENLRQALFEKHTLNKQELDEVAAEEAKNHFLSL
eukprot:GILI01039852.1.p1 GENE.GILI01039852.1~~GILI01039852.1.p1  ORF type:complete len:352 (-),score=42.68 GILI01039852.1:34-1089(-)